MKLVIFGAGKEGLNCYFDYEKAHSIIAFADNNDKKQGEEIFGIEIVRPNKLQELEFDKILVASKLWYREIKQQLKELGISKEKIELYDSVSIREKTLNYLIDANCTYGKEKFEIKWENVKKTYTEINIYALVVDAIGEIIPRFLWIRDDIKGTKNLNVFLPISNGTLRIANKEVLKHVKKQIYLVDEQEIPFWLYVIYNHMEEVNISEVDKYIYRNNVPKSEIDSVIVEFDSKEISMVQRKLKEIDVNKPYVCFLARTAAYNLNTIGNDFDFDFRNMDFLDFQKTINNLKQQGLTSVRMGRAEKTLSELENCIDYAGMYANDFGDMALIRNCDFMVSCNSGGYVFTHLFYKPLLVVNLAGISFGFGAMGYTGMELFIPKKLYSLKLQRCLNLNEIIEIEQECLIWGKKYKDQGIEFINNTPEEIWEATKELMERLNGTWIDTEEDKKMYERYSELYQKMKVMAKENERNWVGEPIPYRMAASYMRMNRYLLD